MARNRQYGLRTKPPSGLASRRAAAVAAYTVFLVAAALVAANPLVLLALLAACLLTLQGSGRLRAAVPYLRVSLYAGVALLIINPLFSSGGLHPLLTSSVGPLPVRITWEGVAFGAGQALRLVVVIVAFAAMTLVLDQDYQLSILSRVSSRSGLVISLATRLLPVLSRDAARISDAQRSRGAELDRGHWRQRAAARGPLLAGLLTQSLERATDIAASMESRGFGRPARTRWSRHLRWKAVDWALAGTAAAAFALLLAGAVQRSLAFTYFPTVANPLSAMTNGINIGLVLLALLPAVWSLRWRPSSR